MDGFLGVDFNLVQKIPSLLIFPIFPLFQDRRIGGGENDDESSMLKRFALERIKRNKKASLFQLGDDLGDADEGEVMTLTHGGRSLSQIEDFRDNPRSDEEEDGEGEGRGKKGREKLGGESQNVPS